MKLEFDDGKLGAVAADALAVPVFKDEAPDAVGTLVEPLRDAGELKGKAGELTLLHSPNGFAARRLLLIGCGDDWSTETAFAFGGQAVRVAETRGYGRLALALEGDAAERMLKACDDQGILLGIGHERRYEPAFEEMKRRVDTGELGTLLHIEINASYNLFAGVVETGWRQDPKQAPAGTLTALGVHLTDYLQTLAGPVSEIYARTSHRSRDFPSDDILSVQFAFKSGVTGYLSSIATTPFYQRISVFGDRGWVETREVSNVTDPDPAVMTWRGMDLETHTRTYKPINTVIANLHDWVRAIETSHAYRFTRQEKLHNIQILDAIVRSASSGRSEPVD